MNTSHSPAKIGLWTDYTTSETWLVLTSTWGYVLPALVGVWLGFSAKFLTRILANFALFIHIRCLKAPPDPRAAPVESTPLLEHQASPAEFAKREEAKKSARILAKVYKDGDGVREFVQELCFNKELSQKYRGFLGLFILFLSTAMVGFIIIGVYGARIQADGPAILASEKCGLWVFNRKRGGDEAATRAGINDLAKETRAGAYAQNCYGTPDPFDAIQCNFLYRSRLAFSAAQYTTDCPFQNEICGQNQTVTFTTDIVDASELGINSQHSPKFRRRTSCTPLSMEYPFIQNTTQNDTTTYYYYYGEKPLHNPPLNYTYTTTGDPFDRLAPAYDVFTYTTSSTTTVESYWKPRPELTHPPFSTLTLIFVSSLRIFYKKWSDDPIFPADKEVYLPGERKPWFRNSDPRARPLACINYIEVCLGDGKTCWPMNAHLPKDAANKTISPPPEFWLMYASLLKTDIYNAIEKRLGRGLIAQSKVSQYFSEALGDHHWVDEVERLVATLHARTQINTWSIATGEDSVHEGKDRYTLITPEEIYGNFCGMFKYNPPGYASIHFIPFIFILLSFPVFLLLSRKWPWSHHFEAVEAVNEPAEVQVSAQGQYGTISPGTGETVTRTDDELGPSGTSSDPVSATSGQDQAQTTGPTATQPETPGDTQATASDDAGGSSEQGAPTPQATAPAVSQLGESRETSTGTPTDSSADIVWEPVVIEKIIEWIVVLVWEWPSQAWRNRSTIGTRVRRLLSSLFRNGP